MALLSLLVDLGLPPSEARFYVTLLEIPHARVNALSRAAGVPRSRGYELAASLVRRGLASERAGLYKRYVPVPLREALDRLLSQRRCELEGLEARARALDGLVLPRADAPAPPSLGQPSAAGGASRSAFSRP